ncbi:hypothetical protein D3C78_1180780 [compost metagenome]
MAISVFDLFKIGIGRVSRVEARLYGSLSAIGADMYDKYKETSRGVLAVSGIEC